MQGHPSPSIESTVEQRWLLLLLATIVGAVVLIGVFAALITTHPSGYGWMMGGDGGWGWMWGMGAAMMTIPVVLFVALIAVLLRPQPSEPTIVSTAPPPDPVSEAGMRYARGEITSAQYRQIREDLRPTR